MDGGDAHRVRGCFRFGEEGGAFFVGVENRLNQALWPARDFLVDHA